MDILNLQQQEAVDSTKGAVLVSAGAGTGKTRVLTHRVASLINKCGVNAQNILAITFTNKATQEMKERIEALCGIKGSDVWVSTFHSLASKILRNNIHLLGENYNRFFTIYDDSDRQKIIKKIIKTKFEGLVENSDIEKAALNKISKAKNDGILPADFLNHFSYIRFAGEIKEIYTLYETELAKSNSLDFDDLILKTIELFKKHANVLNYYQSVFQYIHVDEFQDTNKIQYELIKLLAGKHKNVLVVGDEDQSIYAFRGANYKNLNSFKKDFAPVKVCKLECNYRSTKLIIEKANKLINQNFERSESKNLFTQNESGEDVVYKVCDSDYKEADYIASQILREHKNGTSLKNIAVIFRINAMSRQLENTFVENGIPYKIIGGLKFYERAEIKNLLAYLRLLVNPQDGEALLRIINFPKRGIGDATILKLEQFAQERGISMLEGVKTFSHSGVAQFAELFKTFSEMSQNANLNETAQILVQLLNPAQIYCSKTEEDENRLLNIKSFLVGVNEYCENNENPTLIDFLENVNLDTISTDENTENTVTLSTVHGVKGLEFDVVFIAGCEDGMMPYRRSVEEGEIEEERRLAYVAITRAKKKLFITRAKNRFTFGGGQVATIKSRFLEEMGIKSIDDEIFAEFRISQNFNNFSTGYNYKKQPADKVFYKAKHTISYQPAEQNIKTRLSEIKTASQLFSAQAQKNKDINFTEGARVCHARFGEGTIKTINGQNAIIVFDDGKEKELNLNFAPLEILEGAYGN